MISSRGLSWSNRTLHSCNRSHFADCKSSECREICSHYFEDNLEVIPTKPCELSNERNEFIDKNYATKFFDSSAKNEKPDNSSFVTTHLNDSISSSTSSAVSNVFRARPSKLLFQNYQLNVKYQVSCLVFCWKVEGLMR